LWERFKVAGAPRWRRFRGLPLWGQGLGWVVFVVLLPVVFVAALVLLGLGLTVWRSPPDERAHKSALRAARGRLKTAERTHQGTIRSAEKDMERANKSLQASIAAAENELAGLKSPHGRLLGSYNGCRLYELWVQTPQGSGPVAGAKATCDTASNLMVKSRATLTRMAAGGLLLGPLGAILSLGFKKHKEVDRRELYLLIETPTFAGVVQCPADQGLAARNFAAAVVSAGLNAGRVASGRPAQIDAVQQKVDQLRADGGRVPDAERALESARNDEAALRAIEEARGAVAALEPGPSTLAIGAAATSEDR
jgi:hypothetical protein